MPTRRLIWVWPCLLALLISGAYIGIRLAQNDFDPIALSELGSRYAEGDPSGEPGYDGQFTYYMARDPAPATVEPFLDVPAYRYQRILYPLLARVLAVGSEPIIAWVLPGINWLAHGMATLALCWHFKRRQVNLAYVLIYGLWVGVVSAVGLNLHEPIAYGLVVMAWVLREQERDTAFAFSLSLALFAKETTLLFWVAAILPLWKQGRWSRPFTILACGGFVFLIWQIWLYSTFGAFGVGSGGDMATGFEWIPFMGLIRIGLVDWRVFGLFLLIFGPTIVLPAVWGLYSTFQRGKTFFWNWPSASLLLHALLVVFMPFSTFREPLGLVRITTGLVLSILMVASERRQTRILNYAMFWIAMLAILIPQG